MLTNYIQFAICIVHQTSAKMKHFRLKTIQHLDSKQTNNIVRSIWDFKCFQKLQKVQTHFFFIISDNKGQDLYWLKSPGCD